MIVLVSFLLVWLFRVRLVCWVVAELYLVKQLLYNSVSRVNLLELGTVKFSIVVNAYCFVVS